MTLKCVVLLDAISLCEYSSRTLAMAQKNEKKNDLTPKLLLTAIGPL